MESFLEEDLGERNRERIYEIFSPTRSVETKGVSYIN